MNRNKRFLLYPVSVIVGLFFLVWGLIEAKNLLAPLLTAVILALLILPVSRWLEPYTGRITSSIASTFILFLISLGFAAIFSFQVKVFVDSWPEIQETMAPKVEEWRAFLTEKTFLEEKDLSAEGGGLSLMGDGTNRIAQAASMFGRGTGYFGTYLLTFIYVFFILNSRRHFRKFLLRLFADEDNQEVNQIILQSIRLVQQYLVGKLILIGLLAIVYTIGLAVSGVSNFALIGIIAALFTLIPYLGNIIGFSMAILFGYLTSGEIGVLIGIVITFGVAQFLESYVLHPLIVGDKVDIHPFFVILGVIVGNALWGIIGMILAIPILGIMTVAFLHVPMLKPFGYLFSDKQTDI